MATSQIGERLREHSRLPLDVDRPPGRSSRHAAVPLPLLLPPPFLLPPPPSLATLTPLRGCCCPSSWRCAWLSSPTSTLPHPRLHARAGVRLALQPLHARGETGWRGERWCVHPAGGVRGGGAGRADDAPARLPHHLGGGAAKHARAHPREAACSKCRLAWCHSSPCQPPRAVMRVGPGPLSTLSRSQRATQLARRGFDAAAKAAARSLILHF